MKKIKAIGIDYSLNSPAICIATGDLSFENCKVPEPLLETEQVTVCEASFVFVVCTADIPEGATAVVCDLVVTV